jgi:hypothetical protein
LGKSEFKKGAENGKSLGSSDLILLATQCPGVYSASNRNEFQKQENNVFEEKSMASV